MHKNVVNGITEDKLGHYAEQIGTLELELELQFLNSVPFLELN